MPQYAALDVLNEEAAIRIIDEASVTVWRGKRASDPNVLTTALRRYAPDLVRVGLETGPLTLAVPFDCRVKSKAKSAWLRSTRFRQLRRPP